MNQRQCHGRLAGNIRLERFGKSDCIGFGGAVEPAVHFKDSSNPHDNMRVDISGRLPRSHHRINNAQQADHRKNVLDVVGENRLQVSGITGSQIVKINLRHLPARDIRRSLVRQQSRFQRPEPEAATGRKRGATPNPAARVKQVQMNHVIELGANAGQNEPRCKQGKSNERPLNVTAESNGRNASATADIMAFSSD